MSTLRVNTIYPAFMGEVNIHGIGVPCTFVRLSGCNLRCYRRTKGILCDTPEALEMKKGKMMCPLEIVKEVSCFESKVVCLTGGEPLLQNVKELLEELSDHGYFVVVETNGSTSIAPYRHIRNVSFVVDVKSKSSGEDNRMLEDNYPLLDEKDFLKFVIDTEDDYWEFYYWLALHRSYLKCKLAVGTFWGSKVSYSWLIDKCKLLGSDIYLNMQTHKMACLYDVYKDKKDFSNIFIPKDL